MLANIRRDAQPGRLINLRKTPRLGVSTLNIFRSLLILPVHNLLTYNPRMPNKPTILHIALQSPFYHCFDYLAPANCAPATLQPGVRVKVPFGTKERIGVLLSVDHKTELAISKLKPALAVIDKEPLLPEKLLQLIHWTHDYYHHPIGDTIFTALPKLLREGREVDDLVIPLPPINNDEATIPTPTTHQQKAIDAITTTSGFQPFVLDGVTGSGKTEVYLRVIEQIIQQKKQALVLVPEIGLTPQTVTRFQNRFSVPIAILHSQLTDKERLHAWLLAKSGAAAIIIGTRSAIFTPLKTPGIIILDEEHDQSFKQQSGLRYSARDIAVVRAKQENIPIILGSATPSLESLYNVKRKNYLRLHLPERTGTATHPTFNLIDLRNQKSHAGLSETLIQNIRKHLTNNGQVLIFLNRRGYAPTLICHSCGWVAECKRCDARMTIHQQPKYLHCHHCGATHPVIKKCPQCSYEQLSPLGTGTERLEETLSTIFPDYPLTRMDRDTTRKKNALHDLLKVINNNEPRILIGTQMLAKGHHFPNVTLAAILDADTGLLSSDFRATENIAQLITQVAGRAGRAEKPGEVFIQTYNPQHPLLLQLIEHGYHKFANTTLKERQAAQLPPFAYFALLRAEAKNKDAVFEFLETIKNATARHPTPHPSHPAPNPRHPVLDTGSTSTRSVQHPKNTMDSAVKPRNDAEQLLKNNTVSESQLLGPIPAPMQRKKNMHHAQLLITNQNRKSLHTTCEQLIHFINTSKANRSIRWSLDIDPIDTL